MNFEAIAQALFLLITMSAAGGLHIWWLHSRTAQRFNQPVDAGRTFQGRRLFGDNKRVRGFLALPPAAGFFFLLFGAMREQLPEFLVAGSWALGPWEYAGLGVACGFAFMAAELPNSFLKRQLDIQPGQAPQQRWLRVVTVVLDRVDSILGFLLVLSLLVPVHAATWFWVLLLGPGLHAVFSALLYRLGLKARPL